MAPAVTGAERRRRLAATRLYLVVTPDACVRRPWEEATEAALASGVVGMVQLREKADDDVVRRRAAALAGLARAAGALWILDDRAALAAEAGADGVHVGEDDDPPARARAAVGPERLLGVSAHDAAEVAAAAASGADYAGLGPCFPTRTKALSRAPGGERLVAEGLRGAAIPVFPIGGIDAKNVVALARAGATRAAVGAGVLEADDPRAAALAIHRALGGA
jgi:thiamine-phosphate pyrophosphorylase